MSSARSSTSCEGPATSGKPERLGVFGGTFNPPHLGHLLCAAAAAEALELDRVLFVPTGQPPHKQIADEPGAAVRAELVAAAVGGDSRFAVSTVEVDRSGPSYTVDTLRALTAEYPGSELVLVLGGDMALTFHSWHQPEEIAKLASLGLVEREEIDDDTIRRALAGLRVRTRFFPMVRCDISSTLVRGRAARSASLRYLVPDAVADLIEERRLYRLS